MLNEKQKVGSILASDWVEVTFGNPCPLCNKPDWCFVSPDGNAVVCGRIDAQSLPTGWEQIKTAKDGRNIYRRSTGATSPSKRCPLNPCLIRVMGRSILQVRRDSQKKEQTTTYVYKLREPDESVIEVGMKRIDQPDGTKKVRPYALLKGSGNITKHIGKWQPYLWELLTDSIERHQSPSPDHTPFILIVEGEKCAVEASLKRIATITFDCTAWNETDIKWAIERIQKLRCSVVMWPDHDQAGLDKANKVRQVCQSLNVEYYQLDPNKLTDNPSEGWDIADYLKENDMTGDQLAQLIEQQIKELYLLGQPYPNVPLCITADKDQHEGKKEKEVSITELLIRIGNECHLWHTNDNIAYADLLIDGLRHTYPVKSNSFQMWLSRELYRQYKKAGNKESISTALNLIEAKALFEGDENKIWLRTGEDNQGNIYIDLANDRCQVIKVTKERWSIISSNECPIRFHRSNMQLPLPMPKDKGSLEDLWKIIKIDDKYQPLLVTWLLSCLVPFGSKPIVYLVGSKGAGKTTTGKILKSIVDPTKAPLLPKVGNDKDIVASANNRWLLVYDNLSKLSQADQDNLCRTATGAGFSQRKLYTDMDESYFEYTRPQILTSVDFVPNRSDLLDRCILIKCNRLSDSDRATEQKLDQLVKHYLPGILGGLLDLLVKALANKDSIDCPLPRMADYALLGIAAEIPNFTEAYQINIEQSNKSVIDMNPIAEAIKDHLDEYRTQHPTATQYHCSITSLLEIIQRISDEPEVQRLTNKGLGRLLGGSLKDDLQGVGIVVTQKRTASDRYWCFSWTLL